MRIEQYPEPTHARSWLYALLNAHPPDRRDLYEERVEEAAHILQQKGKIDGFVRYKKNSTEDKNGIDFSVTKHGKTAHHQITSTPLQVEQHRTVDSRRDAVERHYIAVRLDGSHLMKSIPELENELLFPFSY